MICCGWAYGWTLRLWFLSTDNRSTNIQKNPLEQLFSDGVICFVTHSKVAFLIMIRKHTDIQITFTKFNIIFNKINLK